MFVLARGFASAQRLAGARMCAEDGQAQIRRDAGMSAFHSLWLTDADGQAQI